MKANRPPFVLIVVPLLGLLSGVASAHQGTHLVAHVHPHLGVEHLLASVGLAAVVYWLARRARGS